MMRFLTLYISLLSFTGITQVPEDPEIPVELLQPEIEHVDLNIVTEEVISMCGCGAQTHYAGGTRAIQRYLERKFRCPSDIDFSKIEHARMYVEFIVHEDGSVTDIIIYRSLHEKIDHEIIRLIERMPNWIPGEYGCVPAKTRVRFPISLHLI